MWIVLPALALLIPIVAIVMNPPAGNTEANEFFRRLLEDGTHGD